MKAFPGTTARLFAWKFYAFWKPYLSSDVYSLRMMIASALIQVPLFALGLVGLWIILRDRRTKNFAIFFIVLAMTTTAIHVLIVSSMRLRMPYIDPLITVFAAGAIVSFATRFDSIRRLADSINGSAVAKV
jgi:hypothetical protein